MMVEAPLGHDPGSAIGPESPSPVTHLAEDDWQPVAGDADGLAEGLGLGLGLLLGLAIGSAVGPLPIVASAGAIIGTLVGAIVAARDRPAKVAGGASRGRHRR